MLLPPGVRVAVVAGGRGPSQVPALEVEMDLGHLPGLCGVPSFLSGRTRAGSAQRVQTTLLCQVSCCWGPCCHGLVLSGLSLVSPKLGFQGQLVSCWV